LHESADSNRIQNECSGHAALEAEKSSHVRRICPIIVLAVITAALSALFAGSLVAAPMGSALTYQGQLQQSNSPGNIIGQPASGPVTAVCDFRFSLWDAVTNGNLVGATQTNSAVSVSNGLFTVTLDFGASAFNGNARWLDIGVRTNGGGAFTALTPRQLVPVVPYALYATAAGNTAATNFSGTFTNSAYYGNGGGLTNLNYNNITNPPAIPSTNGLATTNYVIAATTNLGRTIAVNMTNALNQFTGTFTNGAYYGSGGGLTNLQVTNITGLGSAALLSSNAFQSASANLTNWSNIGTNQFAGTNLASATMNGILWSNDWSSFKGKQDALGFTPLTPAQTTNAATTAALNATNNYPWGSLYQPTNAALTALATGNGSGLTNLQATTPFSIILVPDSQFLSVDASGSNLWHLACQWISSQITNLNIKAVLSLGDISQDDTNYEYVAMQTGFNLLTNRIPVIPCEGNRDGVNQGDLSYTNFNLYFSQSWITNQHGWNGGFYTNNASQNSYLVFTNEGITYVCVATEFGGGTTNTVMWASNVCSLFPPNTSYCIFITHTFLQMTGLRDQWGDPYDPPSTFGVGFTGEQLWGFWKQIANLGLIANGHFTSNPNGQPNQMPYEARRIDAGTAGNWINQLMCNYQELNPPESFPYSFLKILTFYPAQNVIYASTVQIGTAVTNYVTGVAYTMPMRLEGNAPSSYSLVAGNGTYLTTNSGSLLVVNVATNQFAGTNFASNIANGILSSNDWSSFKGKQDALGYVPQPASGNLTNWSAIGTNQFLGTNALPALTNGFVTASITNGLQGTNINLTQWSAIGTNQFAGTNFGAAVAVTMTNAANQFTGMFTNGAYYGNGGGLTNLNATNLTGILPLSNLNPAVVTNYIENFYANTITASNFVGALIIVTNSLTVSNFTGISSNLVLSGTTLNTGIISNGIITSVAITNANGVGITNLNAANLIGILPQYPTVQVATNTPFTNAVLISPDGTNRAWSSNITGSFTGNGSGLTNLNATNLTGTLPLLNLAPALTNLANGNGAGLTNLIPYTGATTNIDLGSNTLTDSKQTIIARTPVVVGSLYNMNFNNTGFSCVAGRYAYITSVNSNSFSVIDITDPTNPILVSQLIDNTLLNGVDPVEVAGKYAYVANTITNSFAVIDISNPKNPMIVGHLTDNTILKAVDGIRLSGKYAYVNSLGGDSVSVIDISDPTNPTMVGHVIDHSNLSVPYSMELSGKYLYVAAYNSKRLTIVDVSNPTAPVVVGSVYDATQLNQAINVKVVGSYAFVNCSMSPPALTVVNVSDPTNPTIVKYLNLSSYINHGLTLQIGGGYAYIADVINNSVVIIDISNPLNPAYVTSIRDDTYLHGADDIEIQGKYAYITASGGSRYTILDLGGLGANAISAGSIDVANAQIRRNLVIGENAYVNNGLIVGANGIKTDGQIAAAGFTIGASTITNLGSAAANPASAFQPSSIMLTNLSIGNGSGLTNLNATNLVGSLTNNTTGNALTASAGWPTTWSPSSILPGNLPANVTNTGTILYSQLPYVPQPTNATLTQLSSNNGVGLTNLPFAKTFSSTNGYFTFTANADGSTNVTFIETNTPAANLIGIVPQYPTVQIATNAPFTNAVLISPDGTNRAWGSVSATNITGLGSAATNPASAFQPASITLTNLANGNGAGLTNIVPYSGATSDLNLGTNNLNANSLTAGGASWDANLVAQYKMNDNTNNTTVIDSKGYSNGTAQRNTSVLHTNGIVGGALTFDGTNDYINTKNNFQSTFRDSFSISVWVYLDENCPDTVPLVNYLPSGGDMLYCGLDLSVNTMAIHYKGTFQETSYFYTTINKSTWYLFTWVVSNEPPSTVRITAYQNTFQLASQEFGTEMDNFTPQTNVVLGYLSPFPPDLIGRLDNVMIFNKALSLDEISVLYNNGSGIEDSTGFFGNGYGITNIPVSSVVGLGGAATNSASAFQPASTTLTNLSSGNGSGLTNIPVSAITNFVQSVSNTVQSATNNLISYYLDQPVKTTSSPTFVGLTSPSLATTTTNLSISAANGGSGTNGGGITLTSGNGGAGIYMSYAPGNGGNITFTTGTGGSDGVGAANSGTIFFIGGTGSSGTASGGIGGGFTFAGGQGGYSSSASGKGGSITMTSGQGTNAGAAGSAGGDFTMTSGTGGTANAAGGSGGNFTLTSGAGGGVPSSYATAGNGGSFTLAAGNGGAGSGASSSVGGKGGNAFFNPGAGGTGTTAGANGFVGLAVSAGGTWFGNVRVGTITAPAAGVSFSVGQSASVKSNLVVTGTNTAGYFVGNGGGLTNAAGNNFADNTITNGLATTNYVNTATNNVLVIATNSFLGRTGDSGTNLTFYGDANKTNWTGTSTSGWLNTNTAGGYVRIQNGNVTASGTNTANYFIGNGDGLTNGSGQSYITASITNGLATTNYVNTATNNFGNTVAVAMTNGLNSYVGDKITLKGTNGVGSSAAPAVMSVTGGNGGAGSSTNGGVGSAISITTGAGGSGDMGYNGAAGGDLTIGTGNGGSSPVGTAGRGGNVSVTAGNGASSGGTAGGIGGKVSFLSGTGGAGAGGGANGGDMVFTSGSGGDSGVGNAGNGGVTTMVAGTGGTGNSGAIPGIGGGFTLAGGTGGSATIGANGSAGGMATFTGGKGGAGATANGSANGGNGGNLYMYGGIGGAAGIGGGSAGTNGNTYFGIKSDGTLIGHVYLGEAILNGVYQQATNALTSWPTAAATPGGFAIVNSNAQPYVLLSSPGSTAWVSTNKWP